MDDDKFYNKWVILFQEHEGACPAMAFVRTKDEVRHYQEGLEDTGLKTVVAHIDSMPAFEDLPFTDHPVRAMTFQALAHYDNGYTGSVIAEHRHGQTFPTWEVAVMIDGKIDDSNPYIKGGVVSRLTVNQVEVALLMVKSMPQTGVTKL